MKTAPTAGLSSGSGEFRAASVRVETPVDRSVNRTGHVSDAVIGGGAVEELSLLERRVAQPELDSRTSEIVGGDAPHTVIRVQLFLSLSRTHTTTAARYNEDECETEPGENQQEPSNPTMHD